MKPLWLAAVTLVGLLAACASPSPAPVLLTLPPASIAAAAAAAPAPSASMPTIAVRRVAIPEYLVARRVRFRADAATLAEWPNTYWAERVEIGVTREFVSALRAQLPGWTLCEATCGEQSSAHGLQVDVVPLDYLRTERKLLARARLTLVDTAGSPPRVLRSDEKAYEISASADTAQAQAQAIATLIGRIAIDAAALVKAAKP
ncbi:MAG TPA: ABC-type transport auxiliary lipoprotein family protein [Burkholderiaceae bacterium]|nr:ABC-type transport auxiliary lipoprotein family protein [Burkholderiaceae bacterium]